MPAPRWRPTVTVRPQSVLVSSHISFFAPIGCYPALLKSDMTKARFKPRRKVIGFRTPSLHPFWPQSPRSAGQRRGLRRRSRKPCPAGLPRHLFQVGEWRIYRAGAGLAGVFDEAVKPAVDKENRAFARLTV